MKKENRVIRTTCIYILFYIIILIYHFPMGIESDDAVNIANSINTNLKDIFVMRFFWNGRFLTDVLANVIYKIPLSLWKVLDSFIYVIIAKLIVLFVGDDKWTTVLVTCMMLLMFPFAYLSSAGYIATTTNYVYTFLGILLAMVPIAHSVRGEKPNILQYIIAFMGIIYATNHDQSAAVLLGGLLLFLILTMLGNHIKMLAFTVDKKTVLLIAGEFILTVVSYVLMCLTPGHINRVQSKIEMLYWLPQYAEWDILQKVYRGYSTTMSNLLFQQQTLVLIFFFLISVVGLYDNLFWRKLISFIPLVLHVVVSEMGYNYFVIYYSYSCYMPDFGSLKEKYGISLLISFVCIISILISLCRLQWKRLCIVGILLIAFASRWMICLSPTIYASSFRTFICFFFMLIVCNVILFQEIWEKKNQNLYELSILTISCLLLRTLVVFLKNF